MTERRAMISEDDVRKLIASTVQETLTNLGFTVGTDHDRRAVLLDMIYIRKARTGNEEITKWIKRSSIGVAVSAVLYLIADGLIHWIATNTPFAR